MSVTELAIKRPLLITVIFVTLVLFGYISYKSLNYNLLPKFEASVLAVSTTYRGASAEEVQSTVTKTIEDAVSAIEGVDKISSTSMEGVSIITIQLKSGINATNAQRDAERKIAQIKSTLPDDAEDPVVNRFSSDELPIMRISVSADMGPAEIYDLVDQKIKPVLANVDGVGTVRLVGGNQREIQVILDNDKLQAYNLSPAQVNAAVSAANSSYPAGSVESGESRLSIRLDAKITSPEELRNIIVGQQANGGRILLKDIATVTDGETESTTVNRINGTPGIGVEILKQTDANTVNVSKLVKAKMEVLTQQFAKNNLKFQIASDQSVYTLASANAVVDDLFLAVLIVAIVMLFFLHSIRSSSFILISLPSAMIPTFILMNVFGFSLNLMTLMALSLVVGILVDDSIVVLENIYRHLEMGKGKREAAIEGRKEIGFTAIAITLVDVVVFVPLSLAGGMIGNILREFSLVVVFSTLMSLFVSFTLTPLLASRWGKLEILSKKSLWGRLNIAFERFLDNLKEGYGKMLRWSLSHKRYILGLVVVLFIGAIALLPAGFIGVSFISQGDRGEMSVQLEMAPETPLYVTNQMVLKAEKIVMDHPEVVKVFSNVGTQTGSALTGNTSNANLAEINVVMVDKKDRKISTEDMGTILRDEISKIPGVQVTIRPTTITGSAEAPIQIAVKGTDMDEIWQAAKIINDVVRETPGSDYVMYSTKAPKSEIDIKLNRDKMALMGLGVPDIGNAVQIAFRGNTQSKYRENGEEYDINVILDKFDKQDVESVRNLVVKNNKGQSVRLQEIADINEKLGQAVLERTDRLNSIKVTSAAVGRPSGSIVADIQAKLKTKTLPAGVTVEYLGDAQRQGDAFGSLGLALMLGIILIYLIMVALYESVVYPFVVMFSIPVALIGALLALALSMQAISIFAIVGLIMLLGLVAKNGILIVDFTNQLKAEGHSLVDALVEAGKERLRPILMTTVAMIVGMLPIALASGAGAEVKNAMAWVIIGGLSSSLALTVFLVPTMYYIVEKLKIRVQKLFNRNKKQPEEIAAITVAE
jgi:hydrophobic/amphiphilic exporter-1 (mainly G- bacteria), HAE1 family